MRRSLTGAGDSSLSPVSWGYGPVREIRPVRPDEYRMAGEVTAASYREFAPDGDTDWQQYLARIADVAGRAGHTVVLLAMVEGRIAGTATVELDARVEGLRPAKPVPADEAHLRMLGVDPRFRRQGVGRELVEAVIGLARARGKRLLTLETTPKMRAAHAMYEAMGFRSTGRREFGEGLCFDGYELELELELERRSEVV